MAEEKKTVGVDIPQKNKSIINIRTDFDNPGNQEAGIPFIYSPHVFKDNRGGFAESMTRFNDFSVAPGAEWFSNILYRVAQVNRSFSLPGVFRGFHAQFNPCCQGKLVECVGDTPIWDIIVDCRPDSKTFQQFTVFKLTAEGMEKVWVPRGFLHAMIAAKYDIRKNEDGTFTSYEYKVPAQFQYFCDNGYEPRCEIKVNPFGLIHLIIDTYKDEIKNHPDDAYQLYGLIKTFDDGLIIGDADKGEYNIKNFLDEIATEYKKEGRLWYRDSGESQVIKTCENQGHTESEPTGTGNTEATSPS